MLVAAAGNAGPKSPPLYPAADPDVIAVTATDADDKLFAQSNRGRYIAVAAPGTQILVAIPEGGYEVSSGTSYSAAEVSGIVALMLERKSDLKPDKVRDILLATAKDLGPKGRDVMFGAGLADAYGALMAEAAPMAATCPGRSSAPARARADGQKTCASTVNIGRFARCCHRSRAAKAESGGAMTATRRRSWPAQLRNSGK